MIDNSAFIHVEYKNFSQNSMQREAQKDLATQALKNVYGTDKIIIELKNKKEEQNKISLQDKNIELTCLQCTLSISNNQSIDFDTLSFNNLNDKAKVISFVTEDPTGRSIAWRLALSEKKIILTEKGARVKVNYFYSDNLSIQAYGESQKNGSLNEIIPIKVDKWFKTNKYQKTQIIEARVTNKNEASYEPQMAQ